MMKYRFPVLPALKVAGYTTTRLRRDKLLGQATIQALRTGSPVGWPIIDALCRMLNCQPGDLLEYVPDIVAEMDASQMRLDI